MGFNAEISPRALWDLDEVTAELKERSQSYTVARKWFLPSWTQSTLWLRCPSGARL